MDASIEKIRGELEAIVVGPRATRDLPSSVLTVGSDEDELRNLLDRDGSV